MTVSNMYDTLHILLISDLDTGSMKSGGLEIDEEEEKLDFGDEEMKEESLKKSAHKFIKTENENLPTSSAVSIVPPQLPVGRFSLPQGFFDRRIPFDPKASPNLFPVASKDVAASSKIPLITPAKDIPQVFPNATATTGIKISGHSKMGAPKVNLPKFGTGAVGTQRPQPCNTVATIPKASSSSSSRVPIDYPRSPTIPNGNDQLSLQKTDIIPRLKLSNLTEFILPREDVRHWIGNTVLNAIRQTLVCLPLEKKLILWLNSCTIAVSEGKDQVRCVPGYIWADRFLRRMTSHRTVFQCLHPKCKESERQLVGLTLPQAIHHLATHEDMFYCSIVTVSTGKACRYQASNPTELVAHIQKMHMLNALYKEIVAVANKK